MAETEQLQAQVVTLQQQCAEQDGLLANLQQQLTREQESKAQSYGRSSRYWTDAVAAIAGAAGLTPANLTDATAPSSSDGSPQLQENNDSTITENAATSTGGGHQEPDSGTTIPNNDNAAITEDDDGADDNSSNAEASSATTEDGAVTEMDNAKIEDKNNLESDEDHSVDQGSPASNIEH